MIQIAPVRVIHLHVERAFPLKLVEDRQNRSYLTFFAAST
jgi:hypothetical protein